MTSDGFRLNRRRFNTLAAGSALAAVGLMMGAGRSRAAAPIDLGGYAGPALTDQPITIRLLRQIFPDAVNKWYEDRFAAFTEAYPNITIQQETVPFGDLQQKIQLYIQSGDTPDIMMGRSDLAPYLAAGKLAVDLHELLSPDFLGSVQPAALQSCSYRDKIVLMPWEIGVPMIVYNKDLFRQAGVALPPDLAPEEALNGWTITEWLDTLRALKEGLAKLNNPAIYALEASTLGNGGPGSNYSGFEGHFIRMMGDPKAAPDTDDYRTWAAVSPDGFDTSGYFDSEGAIAGMQNYQTLFTEGLTPPGAVPQQFRAGNAAIGWQALSLINRYSSGNAADALPFDWGATVVPKGKNFFGCNVTEAPFISTASAFVPEAAAVLGFLCNDENRLDYHKVRGSVPIRDVLTNNLPLYEKPAQKLAMAASAHYVGCPQTPGWADYFNIANSTIKDIALGAEVAPTLTRASRQINDRLVAYSKF